LPQVANQRGDALTRSSPVTVGHRPQADPPADVIGLAPEGPEGGFGCRTVVVC